MMLNGLLINWVLLTITLEESNSSEAEVSKHATGLMLDIPVKSNSTPTEDETGLSSVGPFADGRANFFQSSSNHKPQL